MIAYDTDRPAKGWYELPPVPGIARYGMAIAWIGKRVYVFGGSYWKTWQNQTRYPNLEMAFSGDAYVFDLETLLWRKLPDVPFPGWGVTAVPRGGHSIVLVAGEKDGRIEQPYQYAEKWRGVPGSPNSQVLVYDTDLEYYRELPSPLPLVAITDELRAEIAEANRRVPPFNPFARYDYSNGVRRHSTPIVIGNTMYLLGNVMGVGRRTVHGTDELLIGDIVE